MRGLKGVSGNQSAISTEFWIRRLRPRAGWLAEWPLMQLLPARLQLHFTECVMKWGWMDVSLRPVRRPLDLSPWVPGAWTLTWPPPFSSSRYVISCLSPSRGNSRLEEVNLYYFFSLFCSCLPYFCECSFLSKGQPQSKLLVSEQNTLLKMFLLPTNHLLTAGANENTRSRC